MGGQQHCLTLWYMGNKMLMNMEKKDHFQFQVVYMSFTNLKQHMTFLEQVEILWSQIFRR